MKLGGLSVPTPHEIEPTLHFDLQDPSNDMEFMWRVRIIADNLMAFPRQMTFVLSAKTTCGGGLDPKFFQ